MKEEELLRESIRDKEIMRSGADRTGKNRRER